MDDKKYQVFVSSTYKDLVDARDKIIETVLSLYHFPVGMEMFSADDSEQWEIIQETINVSDYYVIIIGHRYGSVTADGVSYTEKEYDYAKEIGVPILAFVRNRNAPTQPSERESDPEAIRKLDAFIEKATKSKMCDFWNNTDDLATKVAIALPKIFRRKSQVGWVRGDKALSSTVSQELAELSTENRELRERIRELESQIDERKPSICVDIDSSDSLEVGYTGISQSKLVSCPAPLVLENIPSHLIEFIDKDDIEKYNKGLPDKETIDLYNKELSYYYLAHNEAITPSFNVSNSGSLKANDVFITLKFPEIVCACEAKDIESLNEPDSPIPVSPVETAEEEYRKKKNPLLGAFSSFIGGSNVMLHSPNLDLSSLHGSNINYWSSVDDNVVTLKLNSLIHTRSRAFEGDIVIVPLKLGEGVIEVSVICEEFKNEETFNIPLSVVNKI